MTRKKRMEAARISVNNAMDVVVRVDQRCMAADGPVGETIDEMHPEELRDIWKYLNLAKNHLTD